jgi:4-hydroxy-tetrahydrodipicolinate synthase
MSIKQKYCGVIVPLVSPLREDGNVDEAGMRKIVENVVANGCSPFVAGTTGECSSLTDTQKLELVRITAEQTAGRAQVYAGIADNCMQQSLAKAAAYRDLGADVAVAHLPCYYPIDDEQMLATYNALADNCPLPVMLYNIPVTTNLSMPLSLIDGLSRHDNIVGLKDSERGDDRLAESLALWSERQDFTFHLGWAAKSSYGLQRGLDGIVPSSANLVPGLYRRIYDEARDGNAAEADRIQATTDEISAYYQEGYTLSRSIPRFKAMLSAFDICEPYAAPPMITLDAAERASVKEEVLGRFARHVSQTG